MDIRETTYLVPANSNKSKLIFGIFTPLDLGIFGTGVAMTFLMFMIFTGGTVWLAILNLMPLLITGFLVFPLPNYHNVRIFIYEMWSFYRSDREYKWRGWCYEYEQSEE